MKILFTLFISYAINFSLPANMTENPLITLNIKPEFYFNTPFNHQCIEKISGAKIIEAGFVYKSSEMHLEVFSSNHLFLLNGDNINMFGTAWLLFTSPEFLEAIRATTLKSSTKPMRQFFRIYSTWSTSVRHGPVIFNKAMIGSLYVEHFSKRVKHGK
jgi:hypothetical protein